MKLTHSITRRATIQLSRLVLGTAQFGQSYGITNQIRQVSLAQASEIIRYAAASGINTIDTAISYGPSERWLGLIGISQWNIITKLPAVSDDNCNITEWVEASVKASLSRLKISHLYGILLHRPEQLMGPHGEKLYKALNLLKEKDLVSKIGISIYDLNELNMIIPKFSLDIVQAPFSIIDRRLLCSGWLKQLYSSGIEIYVRSIFLQGLLLMCSSERLKKFHRWELLWYQWDEWLNDVKLTPLQACIRYVLSFQEINKVIVGVDNLNQLKEIILESNGTLPPVPKDLQSHDINLINPMRWSQLKNDTNK